MKSQFASYMRTTIHRIFLIFAVAVMSLSFATPAHAQLGEVYAQILDQGQKMLMNSLMKQMGLGIESAVEESGAATRAELLKTAMADKAVAEALEAYRQKRLLEKLAIKTSADLEQPVTTCQTVAGQVGISSADATAKSKILTSQKRALAKLNGNTNTAVALGERHKATNDSACTLSEQGLGVCKVSTDARFKNLAGADQNAALLFQGADGSNTYEGKQDGPQAEAAQRYIERVIAGVPPEQLRKTDYLKTPQGRAYVELGRRYSAVLSMSSYSLSQIKEARNPQVGLGNTTKLATVSVDGFTKGKVDMSMLEAVERLIATKFSPESMTSAGLATSPNLILRDLAQMSSFQLWIDHKTLTQDARTEALLAHQLALLTEQTLRPQLEAQRTAASRSAAAPRLAKAN